MSVSLTPNSQLGFNRPLTQLVKRILTVTNHNAQPVAFKVKTTAPKTYCVRPNSGRIEAGQTVEVQGVSGATLVAHVSFTEPFASVSVLLQAMKEEPPLSVKCKDKFLVQSTIITPEKEALPLHDLWSTADGEESTVHQQKIKVVYLPPIGEAVEEEDESVLHQQNSLMSTPGDHKFDNVRQSPSQNGSLHHPSNPPIPAPTFNHASLSAEPNVPIERAFSPAADYSMAREVSHDEEPIVIPGHIDVFSPPPEPPMTAAPPVQIPTPAPFQQREAQPSEAELELRARLSDAQAEIERLRNLLASTPDQDIPTFRRRNRGALSDDETVVSNSETDVGGTEVGQEGLVQPDGVPLQTVIMLNLLVFVITYLFF